jgi:hypothetical protein
MRQTLCAAAFAMMAGVTLTSAQAADALYPPPPGPHHHPPHAYPHAYPGAYPHAFVPPPPPRVGWVLMPGIAYAPIHPMDFSLATGEYYSRLWEPYPFCCPDPYYAPAIFP